MFLKNEFKMAFTFFFSFVAKVNGRQDMHMMAVTGLTGWQHAGYKTCLAAIEYAVEIANQDLQILPGFNLVLQVRDEGPNSEKAASEMVKFWRNFQHQLIAPIALGPSSSYGCKAYAKVLKPLHMFAVAKGCTSPEFSVKKQLYYNLVRLATPGENIAMSQVNFIKQMDWTNIAIATSTRDMDFDGSILVNQGAKTSNITVDWYEAIDESSIQGQVGENLLKSLKKRDSRIIILNFARWNHLFDFYCTAFNTGIQGSKYVFIAMSYSYRNVDSMADGSFGNCSRKIIKDQMAITFFIGPSLQPPPTDVDSSFGINMANFFKKIAHLKDEIDFRWGVTCFDNAMTAILALNKTNEKLENQNQSNLTRWIVEPEMVEQLVGESFQHLEATGLFNGYFKLSKRMAMDSKPMFVFKTVNRSNTNIEWIAEITPSQNDAFDPVDYSYKEINKIAWWYDNGNGVRKPKSHAKRVDYFHNVDFIVKIIAITLAGFLFIIQISWICYSIHMRKSQTIKFWKFAYIFGCLLANISAVLFSIGSIENSGSIVNVILCNLRVIFLSISLIFLHGITLVKLRYFSFDVKHSADSTTGTKWPSGKRQLKHKTVSFNNRREIGEKKKNQLQIMFGMVLINFIYLAIWLSVNPLFFKMVKHPAYLDETNDLMIYKREGFCDSNNFNIWIGIEIVSHAVLMIGGFFLSYNFRTVQKWQSKETENDFKRTRLIHLFHCSLFLITIVLMFTFVDSKIRLEILTVVSIIESIVTFLSVVTK